MSKRVVSGIQPTGNLHLGNYLGAIRNWVRMQDEVAANGGDCFFFLADLHAITVHNDPRELAGNVRQMAAALIAAGIDPERSTLFNQAAVPAHAELAWLLAGTARIGWLNRMTQFKDKAGKNREGASWLSPAHWGNGITTEAARAIVAFGFESLGLPVLTSGYFEDNPASGSVLRKLGFAETGRVTRPCLAAGGELPLITMELVPPARG